MASPSPLRIAQVTPYTWGGDGEVNDFIACASAELARRGHEIVVAAPGGSISQQRASRKAIGACRDRPAEIGRGWEGERVGDGGPPVLSIGPGIPLPKGPKPRAAPLPLDVTRSLEELLSAGEFDLIHVHDPFAPSASSAALRHSWSLNVGSFHKPTERILSTQVARPLVEVFFGRLDARTASGSATAALMERFFGGSYEMVAGAAEPSDQSYWPHSGGGGAGSGPLRIAYVAAEERGALRMIVRALRRLPAEGDWEAAILVPDESFALPRISRALGQRLRFLRPADCDAAELIGSADVVCAASGGPEPSTSLIQRAFATGAVPLGSQIDPYAELIEPDERGLMFPPGDEITLAAHIERLMGDRALLDRLRQRSREAHRGWEEVADQLEGVYRRVCARRHPRAGNEKVRSRLASRPTIDCDLHMHTDHSHDCATPVEVLIETAKDRGMGAIAVTDHNEITGALAAREVAERDGGIKVIVGEEVKTAEQGEVIGLFISEKIERGMTMAETVAEIRRQGGLVYVPHPFDRLHSVPDYEHLLEMVDEIDIIETFNPRVAFSPFNEEAERFAAKYRIIPGAGSDGHVPEALGSVRIRLADFDGAEEFLEAMRGADIARKHKNLVYVQALKWMKSASGNQGARRDVADPAPAQGGKRHEQRRARSRSR